MEYELTELLPIVESLSRKYTRNESTSISYETAQQLMEAVLYCIQELEHTSADLPAAVLSAADAYALGYEAVLRKTKQTAERYNALMEGFSSYGNRACEETIAQGFPAFFRWYDPLFAPQEHLLTLDYPLLRPLKHFAASTGSQHIWNVLKLNNGFYGVFPRNLSVPPFPNIIPNGKGCF